MRRREAQGAAGMRWEAQAQEAQPHAGRRMEAQGSTEK